MGMLLIVYVKVLRYLVAQFVQGIVDMFERLEYRRFGGVEGSEVGEVSWDILQRF